LTANASPTQSARPVSVRRFVFEDSVSGDSVEVFSISIRHGDAGDAVASPTMKHWPLFGQKFLKFGPSIHLHSHVSESIFQTKAK